MSAADSVSVFAEGTFEEQIQELVNYLARHRSDEDRVAFIRPFQDVLKTTDGQIPLSEDEQRRKTIFGMVLAEVKGLGDGSEKEIEGFFNLLYSHLFSFFSGDSPKLNQHINGLLQIITSSSTPNHNSVKYQVLSNLFNATPRYSPLRLPVCNALLQLATTNDEVEVLQLSKSDVDRWIQEWSVSSEEKSAFLGSVADAFAKKGDSETSYGYTVAYARSLSPSSPDAESAAVKAISTALRLPFVFNFDTLFKLDAVVSLKDRQLFALLQIFLSGGLSDYQAWERDNEYAVDNYGLDKLQLERKIRLLSLASLGFKNIGRDLSYSEIAYALQIDLSQVEKWVIDVIRAGLLSGKLSQTTQTLHISRSTARSFEREQWEALEKRLLAWKSGLAGVLEVIATARKTAAPPSGSTVTPSAVPTTA